MRISYAQFTIARMSKCRSSAGFWLFETGSLQECIDWVKKCPNPTGEESEIEIRQIFEAEDFGEAFTPELREQEDRLRRQAH